MKKIFLMCVVSLIITSLSAQYKVIVNSSNSSGSLSKKEISDYFLKKSIKWPDGTKVIPIDQQSSSSVRDAFTSEIHGKSVGSIKSYWQQFVFSGKGTPPVEKNSDTEVKDFVKNNAGAIGYISSDADMSGVKVIVIN